MWVCIKHRHLFSSVFVALRASIFLGIERSWRIGGRQELWYTVEHASATKMLRGRGVRV
jgi:hypothetical protein